MRVFRLHFSFWILALGYVLTGGYLSFLVFSSLIFVHEFGHYLVSRILRVKVKRVIFYCFGGVTRLDCLVNLDLGIELCIAIAGILFQSLFYFFIYFLYRGGMIRDITFSYFKFYHYKILFFNLLPIYPLDGGRIVSIILFYFVPYLVGYDITFILSMFFLCLFFGVYAFSYSNILIFVFVGYLVIDFFFKKKYYYSRFLVERYLYNFHYLRVKIIDNYKLMYRDRIHFFKWGDGYISEKNFLWKKFRENKKKLL